MQALKTTAKSGGGFLVDTLVRPPISQLAKKQNDSLIAHIEASVRLDLKTLLENTHDKQTNPHSDRDLLSSSIKLAPKASKFIHFIFKNGGTTLAKMLDDFIDEAAPVLVDLTKDLDDEVTEHAITKIKAELHIIPKPVKRVPPEIGKWPELPTDESAKSVKESILIEIKQDLRYYTQKLLEKIIRNLPIVFEKTVQSVVKKEMDENVQDAKTGLSFLDNFVEKTVKNTEQLQKDIVEDFCHFVWESLDETTSKVLMKSLVEFEDSMIEGIDKTISVVPGL
ncbi:hypothetical protein BC833DRAFT_566134 [Globomyces pollinis-pini]|nr:hypothetical protein BC833DRAFT_566134 [Globomyces pollinis-pini]